MRFPLKNVIEIQIGIYRYNRYCANIVAFMMPVGILGGYYNNIIIHSPTTWYSAPPELLVWCPILDGLFFVVAFVVIYIALWAKTLEIDN